MPDLPLMSGHAQTETPTMPQIVVIAPSVALRPRDRKKLEDAGYVVVIGDPSDVRVIVPTYCGTTDPVAKAAFHAIAYTPHDDVRIRFARQLAGHLAKVEIVGVQVPQ